MLLLMSSDRKPLSSVTVSHPAFQAFSRMLDALHAAPSSGDAAAVFAPHLRQVFEPESIVIEERPADGSGGGDADQTPVLRPGVATTGDPLAIELVLGTRTISIRLWRQRAFTAEEILIADELRRHGSRTIEDKEIADSNRCGAVSPTAPRSAAAQCLRGLGLTPRECEVMAALLMGKRDADIAAELGAAVRTVGKHVEHILAKLAVESRAAAARKAVEWLSQSADH